MPGSTGSGIDACSGRPIMRLSRSRLTRACVNSGVGWPKHASIPGSVGLSMRLSRSRLTRACVNSGIDRPEPRDRRMLGPADSGIDACSGRPTCVYSGVGWPKHASIPGSVGLSMRLSRSRLTGHASIPGSAGSTMRQFRDLSAPSPGIDACLGQPARDRRMLGPADPG